jgi:hypothetical protein
MRQVSLCFALVMAITAIGWVQAGWAASPGIVVDRGVVGVSLGMTQAQVQTRLGKPTLVRCDSNEVPSRHVVWGWGQSLGGSLAPGSGVDVIFPVQSCKLTPGRPPVVTAPQSGGADRLWTDRPSLRTQTGLGVGATPAQVRAGLPPRSLCRVTAGRGFCYVRPDAASGSTRFLFNAGKVASVELQQELGGR